MVRHVLIALHTSHARYISRVVDDAKCILVTRVCVSVCLSVCLSAAAFPHYCTDLDVYNLGMVGNAPGCALLGGFAIGAPVLVL